MKSTRLVLCLLLRTAQSLDLTAMQDLSDPLMAFAQTTVDETAIALAKIVASSQVSTTSTSETSEDTTVSVTVGQNSDLFSPLFKFEEPVGKGFVLLGTFLAIFSVILLWKNERKAVAFIELVYKGRTACKKADLKQPDDANEFDLVHLSGTTHNEVDLCDRDFSVVAKDSYRLKRKVEVF